LRVKKIYTGKNVLPFVLAAVLALKGPTSSEPPYVVPVAPNALTISLLTAGDSVNARPDGTPYRMTGFPDGLGAYDNGDGTFTVLMNHEAPAGVGAVHAHGAPGAFVSKWTIRKNDLSVVHGEDLIQNIALWNRVTNAYAAPAKGIGLSNLCSATFVPAQSMFLSGEEAPEGRVFAHLLDGTSYELARLGRAQWENAAMHPSASKTIVIGLDDRFGGHVYAYIGEKQSSGSLVERAGLTNGTLFVIEIAGFLSENPASGIPSGSAFRLLGLGNVSNVSGATLRAFSASVGATRWQRPEDGAWDPSHPRDFYFVTTATLAGRSRLWRLRFDDLDDPRAGGTLDMLLDGIEGPKMMDNIAVRSSGDVVIQEDPDTPELAKIWRYDPSTDRVEVIAEHDFALFGAGAPGAISNNEESSGIIDVSGILGEGWMLFDVQAHAPAAGEVLNRGQLLAMRFPVTRRRSARH